MTVIRFRVAGRPAPQGSKRHVGGGRMVESSRAVGPWREAVRAETQRQVEAFGYEPDGQFPVAPAMAVSALFALPRPKGHFGTGRNARKIRAGADARPFRRPDIDKLVRAVLDGLVMGGALVDDAQVVDLSVSKHWCQPGEPPGVFIAIEEAK